MANDRDAPCSPQELVSPMTTKIRNISVVVWEAKEPSKKKTDANWRCVCTCSTWNFHIYHNILLRDSYCTCSPLKHTHPLTPHTLHFFTPHTPLSPLKLSSLTPHTHTPLSPLTHTLPSHPSDSYTLPSHPSHSLSPLTPPTPHTLLFHPSHSSLTLSAPLTPSPLHLSAPEDILPLSLHLDRHDGLLGLFDGIHLGGDGAELVELMTKNHSIARQLRRTNSGTSQK